MEGGERREKKKRGEREEEECLRKAERYRRAETEDRGNRRGEEG